MTVFIPTHRVTINRPTGAVDELGEETTAETVTASGVPCAIIQTDKRVWSPRDSRLSVVTYFTLRFRPNVDVRVRDRVTDGVDSWVVTKTSRANSAVARSDVRVEAELIS